MEIKCIECKGDGIVPVYRGCNQMPSNCCGGCSVDESCEDCKGSGIIEINPYEYIEKHREDLHEELLESIDKLVDFFGKEIVEEYLVELSENL